MSSFKNQFSIDKRTQEASRIMKKYPDRVPVIVEKAKGSEISNIDKKKYLVPSDLTMGQFMYVIRKRINLKSEQALFLFVNNNFPSVSELMYTVYKENYDTDGFLYILYSGENSFG
jgi:GABA(A) receptor-associated protein